MGNRLSKIVTRTGDDGTTGLADGSRIEKDHTRLEAIGTIDELNSLIGLLVSENPDGIHSEGLTQIQHTLFDMGGELSIPDHNLLTAREIDSLEKWIDQINTHLTPLKEFILPGGGRAASLAHLARTVCRRAERRLVTLSGEAKINHYSKQYLNRLSDLLFILARDSNRIEGKRDSLWKRAESIK